MFVSQILEEKGHTVHKISQNATIMDVCLKLAEQKIGAVVIVDSENKVTGILSERDIVRSISSNGTSALEKNAEELMTREVVSCTQHETIDEVMGKMSEGRFRHLPIIEDGNLVGLISIGDVVKHKIAAAEQETEQIKSYITNA